MGDGLAIELCRCKAGLDALHRPLALDLRRRSHLDGDCTAVKTASGRLELASASAHPPNGRYPGRVGAVILDRGPLFLSEVSSFSHFFSHPSEETE